MSIMDHGHPTGKIELGRRKERRDEGRKKAGRKKRKGSGLKNSSLNKQPHPLIVAFNLHGPRTP